MTVRVIRQEIPKQVLCKHCGSLLEYVFADVTTQVNYDYLGDADYHSVISCPCCEKDVVVK